MISNCEGCRYEFEDAIYHQDKCHLHLATCVDIPTSYPVGRYHFGQILVDDDGKIVIW